MSDQLTLPAEARDRAGKGASRACPRWTDTAVVYGEKKEPLAIHVEEKLLYKMLLTGHFMNSVVMIDFEGKPHRTLPKAVDFHPVTSRPIHVDFLRIGEHTKVTVAVQVRFDNEEESPASSAAACSTSSSTSSSWSATLRNPERDPHRARRPRDRRFDPYHPGQPARGRDSGEEDEDFTVATIVAPSAMKAEEEEEAPRPLLPRKGELAEGEEGDEGEGGEAAEGETKNNPSLLREGIRGARPVASRSFGRSTARSPPAVASRSC